MQEAARRGIFPGYYYLTASLSITITLLVVTALLVSGE